MYTNNTDNCGLAIVLSKFGMAENLVTNLIAFALIGNIGGDDTAERI